MKILIACEESQAVCIEFRKLGFEAYSCDILPCSGGHPEWHINSDVTAFINGGIFQTEGGVSYWIKAWDLIIAFPPCTHLCVSGAKHFAKKRLDGRQQQGIDFFKLFTTVDCKHVSIENPVGIMSTEYCKPSQVIQPYMFGDPVKKTTCLWLKGLPLLVETENVKNYVQYYTSKAGAKMSEWNARQLVINGKKYGYHTDEFKKHRSKTFPGIAKAMAEQWGAYLFNPVIEKQTTLF